MKTDLGDVQRRVQLALDQIRPYLQEDQGNIEFVEITSDMKVHVRLIGACSTCSMSTMTMRAGVEENVKRMAPEITGVIAVA